MSRSKFTLAVNYAIIYLYIAEAEQPSGHGSKLPQGIINVIDNSNSRLGPESLSPQDQTWAAYMGKKKIGESLQL